VNRQFLHIYVFGTGESLLRRYDLRHTPRALFTSVHESAHFDDNPITFG
jgi:hypothetical protein